MKVLVVGGAGYIGSHVVKAMLKTGHDVCVFDNLSSGRRDNLFPEAEFFEGDILKPQDLASCLEAGYDAAVHLAAFKAAGESMLVPEKYSVNNISGTMNLLNAFTEFGVRRVVFSSSAAVYGEPEYVPIDEEHPKNPENYYGFTKLEIERFLDWYDRLKGIKYAALRYFNAAGYDVDGELKGLEQNPANLLPVVMETAAGWRDSIKVFGNDYDTKDGTGVRDYVHVTDLASGHVKALDYIDRENKSITVNLGSEEGLSVMEIIQAARRISGQKIDIEITARRAGDPAGLVAASSLANKLLGWKAEYSDLDTLVETSWNAYKDAER